MTESRQYKTSLIVLSFEEEIIDVITGKDIGLLNKLKRHLHWDQIQEELEDKKIPVPKSLEELEKLIYTSDLKNKITLYKDKKITVYR